MQRVLGPALDELDRRGAFLGGFKGFIKGVEGGAKA